MSNIDPDYYRKGGIETYDFIKAKGLGFEAGNVVKYLVRYKDKGGLEDLRKAAWYLEKLIMDEGHCDPVASTEPVANADLKSARDDLLESLASFHQGDIFPAVGHSMMSATGLADRKARHDAGKHCNCTGRTQLFACPVHHLGRRPSGLSYASLAAGVDQAGVHEGDD